MQLHPRKLLPTIGVAVTLTLLATTGGTALANPPDLTSPTGELETVKLEQEQSADGYRPGADNSTGDSQTSSAQTGDSHDSPQAHGVGGPLADTPSAAATSAEARSSYTDKRDYLMPVLTGQWLGTNGRYGSSPSWISNWAAIRCSSSAREGTNIRITSACTSGKLTTTVLNPTTRKVVSTKTITLSGTLPLVGGVEAMDDGYIYLLTGKNNAAESDTATVLRITKYTASLTPVASASLTAGDVWWGVQTPFRAGSPSMALVGDTLYVHMARTAFKMGDGLNHQMNLTLSLDTKTMSDFVADDFAYSSHSFNQFARSYNGASDLFVADHGDAYPRAIFGTNLRNPLDYDFTEGTILSLTGATGDNYTAATLNSVEIAGSTAALVGTSAPQQHTIQGVSGVTENKAGQAASNLYFGAFNLKATGDSTTPTFRWLTDYNPKTSNTLVGQPTVTALPSGNFVVLYQMTTPKTWTRTLHYLLVDNQGNQVASKSFSGLAYLPSSSPVLLDNKLYWVGAPQVATEYLDEQNKTQVLMGMDLSNPSSPSMILTPPPNKPKVTRLAGSNRYGTNDKINQKFKIKGGPVFVATGADFADALSIGPVVGITGGTLFLTPRNSIPQSTLDQIKALTPSAVYIVGGTGAVSAPVATKVGQAAGKSPIRVQGSNRYGTSEAVYNRFFVTENRPVATAFVATGRDFPDALSAASAGSALKAPVLLVNGTVDSALSSKLTDSLKAKGTSRVLISGGVGAVNANIENNLKRNFPTQRLNGSNRYATNAAVNNYVASQAGSTALATVWIATGADFPDALSAAAPSGKLSSRLVLSNGTCIPKPVVTDWLTNPDSQVTDVYLAGGTGALKASVANLTQCK